MSSVTNFASMSIMMGKDDSGQEINCSNDLEIASFLALIESQRNKGGGLFKKQAQKISFVSYVGWPFRLVKKFDNDAHIVFDMLEFFSHKIDSASIPDTDGFIRDIKSQITPDEYISELTAHQETFTKFVGKDPYIIPGYLDSNELINDFTQRSNPSSAENTNNFTYLLPSRISDGLVNERHNTIMKIKNGAMDDLEKINSTKDSLMIESRDRDKFLEVKTIETMKKYNAIIDKLKPEVSAMVTQFQHEMNKQIDSIENDYTEIRSWLVREKSKHEMEEIKYTRMGPARQKNADHARHNKNRVNQQISQLDTDTLSRKKSLKKFYENQIEEQHRKITSQEEYRDAEVKRLEINRKEISQKTTKIYKKLDWLAEQKRQFIEKIENMGVIIPPDLSMQFHKSPFLIYVPMLVACLKTDKKNEWLVYPPMTFKKTKGWGDSFKGFGKGLIGGIILPLEPRTKLFDEILKKRFEDKLKNDASLEDELLIHCQDHNILDNPEAKTKFEVGIEKIKEMRWFKDNKKFHDLKSGIESQFNN